MEDIKDIKNQDQDLQYLIKRWQKISSAVYLVSSFIKDTDQIKWDIRNRSLLVLSFLHELTSNAPEKHVVLDHCLRELQILISELDLAVTSGIVGRMNYTLINDEIELYQKEVTEHKMKDSLLSPLQKEFMKVEKIEQYSIGHNIGQIDLKRKNDRKDPKVQSPSKKQKKDTEISRTERRNSILTLLKEKGSVSIKDISVSMKNYSEKTIQRELAALVAEGVLYKKGDRRWSTYSLKP